MVFPLINRYKVYKYGNDEVVIYHQDLFRKVYLRTIVNEGNSTFYNVNWWKFAKDAKFAYELQHSKYEDNYRNSLQFV